MITIYEALTLMITFSALIVSVIAVVVSVQKRK